MSVGLRRWGSRAARVTARLGIAAGGIAGVAALASAADYAAKCGWAAAAAWLW
jgi:hypothetical protein